MRSCSQLTKQLVELYRHHPPDHSLALPFDESTCPDCILPVIQSPVSGIAQCFLLLDATMPFHPYPALSSAQGWIDRALAPRTTAEIAFADTFYRLVWLERDDLLSSSTPPKYPQLKANASTDVLVVGGGIAGLHIAYELLTTGMKKVILVEDGSEYPWRFSRSLS